MKAHSSIGIFVFCCMCMYILFWFCVIGGYPNYFLLNYRFLSNWQKKIKMEKYKIAVNAVWFQLKWVHGEEVGVDFVKSSLFGVLFTKLYNINNIYRTCLRIFLNFIDHLNWYDAFFFLPYLLQYFRICWNRHDSDMCCLHEMILEWRGLQSYFHVGRRWYTMNVKFLCFVNNRKRVDTIVTSKFQYVRLYKRENYYSSTFAYFWSKYNYEKKKTSCIITINW